MSPSLALIKKKKVKNYLILSTAPLYEFSRASHFFLSSESKTSTTRRKYK